MAAGTSLLLGVVFGLAMAAPPGPMNAVIAEESVVGGWSSGFRAGLGAMTGDAIFAALAFVGVVGVVQHAPTLRAAMVGAGGLLMCYFALEAARSAAARADPSADEVAGTGAGFRKALALALTNPYQIVFWLTVGVGLLQPGELDVVAHAPWLGAALEGVGLGGSLVVRTGSPALLAGFFGGILAWIVGYPAALVAVGERSERAAPVVAGVSALLLAGFGVVFLADAALALR